MEAAKARDLSCGVPYTQEPQRQPIIALNRSRSVSRTLSLIAILGVMSSPCIVAAADDTLDVIGTWQADNIEHAGNKVDDEKVKKITLNFEKDKVTSDSNEGDDGKNTFSYSIDQKEALKKIDFEGLDGKVKGKKIFGIIRKDGENLQICISFGDVNAPNDRPTDFAGRVDRPWVVITLKPKK